MREKYVLDDCLALYMRHCLGPAYGEACRAAGRQMVPANWYGASESRMHTVSRVMKRAVLADHIEVPEELKGLRRRDFLQQVDSRDPIFLSGEYVSNFLAIKGTPEYMAPIARTLVWLDWLFDELKQAGHARGVKGWKETVARHVSKRQHLEPWSCSLTNEAARQQALSEVVSVLQRPSMIKMSTYLHEQEQALQSLLESLWLRMTPPSEDRLRAFVDEIDKWIFNEQGKGSSEEVFWHHSLQQLLEALSYEQLQALVASLALDPCYGLIDESFANCITSLPRIKRPDGEERPARSVSIIGSPQLCETMQERLGHVVRQGGWAEGLDRRNLIHRLLDEVMRMSTWTGIEGRDELVTLAAAMRSSVVLPSRMDRHLDKGLNRVFGVESERRLHFIDTMAEAVISSREILKRALGNGTIARGNGVGSQQRDDLLFILLTDAWPKIYCRVVWNALHSSEFLHKDQVKKYSPSSFLIQRADSLAEKLALESSDLKESRVVSLSRDVEKLQQSTVPKTKEALVLMLHRLSEDSQVADFLLRVARQADIDHENREMRFPDHLLQELENTWESFRQHLLDIDPEYAEHYSEVKLRGFLNAFATRFKEVSE